MARNPADAIDRHRAKYGRGVSSYSYRTRLALTTISLLVVLFCLRQVYLLSLSDDPRPAAFWVVVLMPVTTGAAVLGWGLWRPAAEWRRSEIPSRALEHEIRDATREKPRHRANFPD